LTNVIRDMLGGALGYSTKGGVMGWIFRAIVMRYGWSILRSVLGGVLGRR
jgi:predicted membrane protein